MGKADHPTAARPTAQEMDTVCRDCGRKFAELVELVSHYDKECRPPDRQVAAGLRYRPNNVVSLASIRRVRRR